MENVTTKSYIYVDKEVLYFYDPNIDNWKKIEPKNEPFYHIITTTNTVQCGMMIVAFVESTTSEHTVDEFSNMAGVFPENYIDKNGIMTLPMFNPFDGTVSKYTRKIENFHFK